MSDTSYHHKNLRQALIEAGLKLIQTRGPEGFSLRGAAAMCGVSHAAPYKHFADKRELLAAIYEYVDRQFAAALEQTAALWPNDPYKRLIAIGKRYVQFFCERPDDLKFLFLSEPRQADLSDGSASPKRCGAAFDAFRNVAAAYLAGIGAPPEENEENMLAMWAMVHGLSVLFTYRTVDCKGDRLALAERILIRNLKFYR